MENFMNKKMVNLLFLSNWCDVFNDLLNDILQGRRLIDQFDTLKRSQLHLQRTAVMT